MGGWNGSILDGQKFDYKGGDGYNGDCIVYVKGHEKRKWLRDLLLDEARRTVYVENIEAHYEDIESLSKLDVTHTLHCQNHVMNYKMFLKYTIGGITTMANKHMLSANMVLFLFLLSL